jgi:F-type H+-transporting ATPase subunit b
MQIDWWTLGLQAVNFAVLVWLLHRFLYKPVLRIVDARQAAIEKRFDEAKAAHDQAAAELADVQAQRTHIGEERKKALQSAAEEAEERADARLERADAQAESLIADARKRIEAERQQVLAESREAALELSGRITRNVLEQLPGDLRTAAWIDRIEQYLDGLPQEQAGELTATLAGGAPLRVVTADPLPDQVAEDWRGRLQRRLGSAPVEFAVDPELLAGAELHFPVAILHFSVRNALDTLRAELESDAGTA